MSKISKSKLKTLIKECLVEILTESTHIPQPSQNRSSRSSTSPQRKERPRPRPTAMDNIRFENNVNSTVNQITSDPMMASIFADTAVTTLQEQLEADSRGPSTSMPLDSVSLMVDQADPMDLFADVADNWATLAFDDKKSP